MTEININKILNELQKDYSILLLTLLSINSLINNNLPFIIALIIFAAFDYLVFQRIVKTDINLNGLIPYRIVQTLLQITLGYFVFHTNGLESTIWFVLFWWFGICDTLFYLIGKEKFLQYNDMFWVWWTPLGILNYFLKNNNTGYTLLYNNLIIIVIYLIYKII
jgi:hypothetical protein